MWGSGVKPPWPPANTALHGRSLEIHHGIRMGNLLSLSLYSVKRRVSSDGERDCIMLRKRLKQLQSFVADIAAWIPSDDVIGPPTVDESRARNQDGGGHIRRRPARRPPANYCARHQVSGTAKSTGCMTKTKGPKDLLAAISLYKVICNSALIAGSFWHRNIN